MNFYISQLNKLIVLIFFLCGIKHTQGQESSFRVGLTIRPIQSSVYQSDPNLELSPFNSLSFGATLDYELTTKIFLSSGIEYTKKGAKGETLTFDNQGFSTGTSPYRFNFKFIQLPIYATYKTNGKYRFYTNLGCNLGYLYDQSITHDDNAFPKSETNFNVLELSLLLGAGVEASLNEQFDLGLGIRNNRAFTSLESENGYLKLKTNTIGILASINFNF